MLGLTLPDWIVLVLWSITCGGILNKWIFDRFQNHTLIKFLAVFIAILIITGSMLASANQPIYKEVCAFLSTIFIGILLGIAIDNMLDRYQNHSIINGRKKK